MDNINPQNKIPCPSCGRLIEPAITYCNYCGQPVGAPPPPVDYYAPVAYAQPPVAAKRPAGWAIGCIVVAVVATFVGFIGVMVALAMPNYINVKGKAKEAEDKANLHNIQLAVERFAVDHDGSYPPYLIGGEPRAAASVVTNASASAFQGIADCPVLADVADPLIAGGYLTEYPRNPFVRSGIAIHTVQENLPSAEFDRCDPLRNATPEGAQYGTRFGAECNLMGSVLADPRYRQRDYSGQPAAGSPGVRTYADIEYEFWDQWIGDKPRPFLPGDFFYKGMGPVIAWDPQAPNPVIPTEVDQYILAAYGGIRTKGKDIIGEEQPVPASLKTAVQGAAPGDIWYMTRSEVSNDPARRQGSPYSFSPNAQGIDVLAYGNPNGIRDAIILVLTAGEDYIGNP